MSDQIINAPWQDRLAAARARQAAAALSADDQSEIDGRAAAAKAEAEADEAEAVKRNLDLARRLDAARMAKPADTFRAFGIKGWPDTFVIRRNGAAFAAWQTAERTAMATESPTARAAQIAEARLQYAQGSVYDWNGRVISVAEDTLALIEYLKANPGHIVPITDAALEMAGVVAEAAKS
jgi:hypothetical protein